MTCRAKHVPLENLGDGNHSNLGLSPNKPQGVPNNCTFLRCHYNVLLRSHSYVLLQNHYCILLRIITFSDCYSLLNHFTYFYKTIITYYYILLQILIIYYYNIITYYYIFLFLLIITTLLHIIIYPLLLIFTNS